MKYMAAAFCAMLAFAGCQEREMPKTAPPLAAQQKCAKAEDCILINISCDGCCEREAINRTDSMSYMDLKSKTCVGKKGSICDCSELPAQAICENTVCKMVVIPKE